MWQKVNDMKTSRDDFGICDINNGESLLIASGYNGRFSRMAEVIKYNEINNTWITVKTAMLKEARVRSNMIQHYSYQNNNHFYFIGGNNGFGSNRGIHIQIEFFFLFFFFAKIHSNSNTK